MGEYNPLAMSTPASNSPLESRITIDPALCNKRITVQTILEFLGAGETREEILHQYPSLEGADIDACLAFAAKLMGHSNALR